jgi:uncharacterized protein with HEPN domain
MQRDRRVYIVDAVQAGERVMRFVAGVALAEYESDEMIHSAVERQFEIIGEALRQLGRVAPDVVTTIPSYRSIVAFRNQLAHGYFAVQHEVVWAIAIRDVPPLVGHLRALLATDSD